MKHVSRIKGRRNEKIFPYHVHDEKNEEDVIEAFSPGMKMIYTSNDTPKFVFFEKFMPLGENCANPISLAFDMDTGFLMVSGIQETKSLFLFS